MPEPDLVDEASGPSCPPADCNISARCWGCYQLIDGLWRFIETPTTPRTFYDVCSGTKYTVELGPPSGHCDFASQGWGDEILDEDRLPCWTANNYQCPECGDEGFLQCGSMYGLRGLSLYFDMFCEDNCCEIVVTITYTVYKTCDELVVIPDPPLSPETEYTHTFSASDICSCEDMASAVLTHTSTTSTNNARGITVPDVCNTESAIISLRALDASPACGACICFDCADYLDDDISVSITGSEFTGTVVCEYNEYESFEDDHDNLCFYNSSVIHGATCDFTVGVQIVCLPCKKFNIYIIIATTEPNDVGGIGYRFDYELLGADCGSLSGFTCTTDPPDPGDDRCDLTDFTFSLS